MNRYIAFDLGAGSGRAVLGELHDGKLILEEVARFPNSMTETDGHLYWDVYRLFDHMKTALSRCAARPGVLSGVGVDTWGVDYGLLGADGDLLGLPYSYRDHRTSGAMDEFFRRVPRERVYELTGIQFMELNTLFQLCSERDASPSRLDDATDLLFMSDIFNYFLCGTKVSERTFCTTSQLYNPRKAEWEEELFATLRVPASLMQEIVSPGTVIGRLGREVCRETEMPDVPVVAVASHDTASAVAAVPSRGESWAYISLGTWSLMGVETPAPVINGDTLRLNFTNEGGFGGTTRLLKNVAGLWLLQMCGEEWGSGAAVDYAAMVDEASGMREFAAFIDPDPICFSGAPSVPSAVREYCRETGQAAPVERAAVVRTLLEGLALRYREVLGELREVYGHPIEVLHVVGGGAHNELLCRLTADATGVPVVAGPAEATAAGNVLVQAYAQGELRSLAELREVVAGSFALTTYEPDSSLDWDGAFARFLDVKARGRKA